MNKTYQLQTLDAQGQRQTRTIEPGPGKSPTVIAATPGERYALFDVQQGSAPDNIRVQRTGKHLRVLFEGSIQADLVLENFYSDNATNAATLVGSTDQGAQYEYLPESAQAQDMLRQLSDGAPPQGMALGGAPLPAYDGAGAAVGLLAPVAAVGGLGLGAVGAGVLGAAALAGGGGGGGGGSTTKPGISQLGLAPASDSGIPNDLITNVQTPTIKGKATAGAQVTVKLNEKDYFATADAVTGEFSITLPQADMLKAGRYPVRATATLGGLTSDPFDGSTFVVDVSSADNINATTGSPSLDPNTTSTLAIVSMSDDTGIAADFAGSDDTLVFRGSLDHFSDNGDKIRVSLEKVGATANPVATAYIAPDTATAWHWDLSAQPLASGRYTLQAVVVDGAGNIASAAENTATAIKSQTVIVDNDAGKNVDANGNLVDDANALSATNVLIGSASLDTGRSASDFVTSDNTLVFKGSLEHFTDNGDRVLVQLKNSAGVVLFQNHLTPSGSQWTWDLSAQTLSDGQYTLDASLVDLAGNTVSNTHAANSQTVVVDASLSTNVQNGSKVDDANASLSPNTVRLTDDTQTPGDWITNDSTPIFSGHFGTGKVWSTNGDLFRFQVFDNTGAWLQEVDETAISADKASWSASLQSLADGSYLSRALITDAAGNVIGQDQQAFVIDHAKPSLGGLNIQANLVDGIVTSITLATNEAVHYTITKGGGQDISGDYTGQAADFSDRINGTFAPGTFQISLRDSAGNESLYTNTSTLVFNNVLGHTASASNYQGPPSLSVLGPVGRHALDADQTLDLTSIILDANQHPAIHNSIDMTDASAQRLSLSLNDVLSVGAYNSFSSNGRVQLMVQGDEQDRVSFEDVASWKARTDTTVNGVHYWSYVSNNELAEVLVQQAVALA